MIPSSNRPHPIHRSLLLPLILATLPLVALGVWRAMLVDGSYAAYSACSGCLHAATLAHELRIVALVLLLVLLARALRSLLLKLPLAFLAVLTTAAMAIDTVVFRLLHQRMYLHEVFRFAGEGQGSWSVVQDLVCSGPAGFALVALAVLAPVLVGLAALLRGRHAAPALAGAGLLIVLVPLAALMVPEPDYVLGESWRNVLEVNLPAPLDRPHSVEGLAQMREASELGLRCHAGESRKPDIIVLLVESLSAYHSHLYAQLMDATPRIDALARQHRYAPEFIANGFHSDGGLISVFAGQVPVPSINRMSSIDGLSGFEVARNDFFARMEGHGYQTAFFTGGTLGFLGKDRWTRALGFDLAEGGESSHYGDLPRGQFGSPPDAALLQRFIGWLDQRQSQQPLFAGMLTVHTHPPFAVPGSGQLDEEAAFRHVDQLVGDFHAALDRRGFFDNGMLIISGDHRSMTPLKAGERERYGESAFARVPMVIVGPAGAPRGPIVGRFQHTDLVPSILQLVDDKVCVDPSQGLMFSDAPRPADFVMHTSGVRREEIMVFSSMGEARIVLDGDDTRWIGPRPAGADALLNRLVLERVERGQVRSNRLEFLWNALGYPSE